MSEANPTGRFVSAEAECPFYRTEENKKITCEGFQRGLTIQLSFMGTGTKSRYSKDICKKDFSKCIIYRLYMITTSD